MDAQVLGPGVHHPRLFSDVNPIGPAIRETLGHPTPRLQSTCLQANAARYQSRPRMTLHAQGDESLVLAASLGLRDSSRAPAATRLFLFPRVIWEEVDGVPEPYPSAMIDSYETAQESAGTLNEIGRRSTVGSRSARGSRTSRPRHRDACRPGLTSVPWLLR